MRKKGAIVLKTYLEATTNLDVNRAIAGMQVLRKKLVKRGIKVSVKEILKMKEAGRK